MNLKLALRRLFKTPFVSIVAVLSLALGIGANAAIFSLFDQMLLRALAGQRRTSWSTCRPRAEAWLQSCSQPGDCEAVFSYPMFRDLEKAQQVFAGIAAHGTFGANLSYRGQTMQRRRHAGVGQLLSGARLAAGARAPAERRRRSRPSAAISSRS